jgi:hypothetical protein
MTGMILCVVGSVFILGKLKESPIDARGEATQLARIAITTASPGLFLATLGTILMITTIVNNPPIDVRDRPTYVSGIMYSATGAAPASALPDPTPIDLGPLDTAMSK